MPPAGWIALGYLLVAGFFIAFAARAGANAKREHLKRLKALRRLRERIANQKPNPPNPSPNTD